MSAFAGSEGAYQTLMGGNVFGPSPSRRLQPARASSIYSQPQAQQVSSQPQSQQIASQPSVAQTPQAFSQPGQQMTFTQSETFTQPPQQISRPAKAQQSGVISSSRTRNDEAIAKVEKMREQNRNRVWA